MSHILDSYSGPFYEILAWALSFFNSIGYCCRVLPPVEFIQVNFQATHANLTVYKGAYDDLGQKHDLLWLLLNDLIWPAPVGNTLTNLSLVASTSARATDPGDVIAADPDVVKPS